MRLGLNTGLVVVASIGDNLRMDYTAVGDTTNLAARMLNLAAPGQVVIAEDPQKAVSGYFVTQPLGAQRLTWAITTYFWATWSRPSAIWRKSIGIPSSAGSGAKNG